MAGNLLELFSPTIPELIEIEATEEEVRKNIGSRNPDLLDVYNHRTCCENCSFTDYDKECPFALREYDLIRDDDGIRVIWETIDYCRIRPSPIKAQRIEYLMSEFRLPKEFVEKTINEYTPKNNSQIDTKQHCVSYVNNFLEHCLNGVGLILTGPTGTGKTHLMSGLGKALINNYQRLVRFVDVGAFCSDYLYGSRSFEEKKRDIDSMKYVDVLILDDLGAELELEGGKKAKPIIMNIIQQRYNATKPTIITTNFTTETEPTLEHYLGKRVFSRVRGKNINLALAGEDHRIQSAWGDIAKEVREEPDDGQTKEKRKKPL